MQRNRILLFRRHHPGRGSRSCAEAVPTGPDYPLSILGGGHAKHGGRARRGRLRQQPDRRAMSEDRCRHQARACSTVWRAACDAYTLIPNGDGAGAIDPAGACSSAHYRCGRLLPSTPNKNNPRLGLVEAGWRSRASSTRPTASSERRTQGNGLASPGRDCEADL